jgi:heat shock protein HtpX
VQSTPVRSRPSTPREIALARRVVTNRRRALLLVVAMGAVVGAVAGLLSILFLPQLGALVVFAVVGVVVAASAWWGAEPLTRWLIDARPADPIADARLFNLVDGLCSGAGLPRPTVCVVDAAGLNALAMGRSHRHATLVVTEGLLRRLSRVELEAVLAQQLAHIKSNDILTATIAVPLFGVFNGPARAATGRGAAALAAAVLLPLEVFAGLGLQHAVDHPREAEADLNGSALTRYPPGMVAALEKMRDGGTLVDGVRPATAHLWLSSPLPAVPTDHLAWLAGLFETHPTLEERIAALREL